MILVTGATGILGRVIALELLKQGKDVRATKRSYSNLKEVRDSYQFYTDQPDFYFNKIQWIDTDFDSIESLQNALEGVDEVYHCAAIVSFNPKDDKNLYKTNIEGTKNLLYAVENSSVKKFLFVSSIAVLDGFNENGMMDENSDFNPKVEHSGYAISKHFSEMEVWRASAEGLNTVIINPGVIIGTGNWGNSSGDLFKKLSHSRTFPGGTAYIDVRDVAKIAVELMKKKAFGQRFILISENEKFRLVSDKVRVALGKPKAKLVPEIAYTILPIISFLFGWLFPILKLMSKNNIETVRTTSKVSNQKITEFLDYQFIPVSESIDFHLKNYMESLKS